MNEMKVKYKATIKVLTPVYIGSQKAKVPICRYATQVKEGNKAFLANLQERAVLQTLKSTHLGSEIIKKMKKFSKLQEDNINYILKVEDKDHGRFFNKLECCNNQIRGCGEIHPIIRNIFHQPYIPASTIKGAIRTALLYSEISKDSNLVGEINKAIRNHIKRIEENIEKKRKQGIKKSKKPSRKDIVSSKISFKNTTLSNCINEFLCTDKIKASQQHRDLMRAISISESYLHKDTCAVYEAKVYTDAKSKDISIFIEAFPPGITVAIDITVDKWLLKEFENPIDFETKILESLRTFSKVIEDEDEWVYESLQTLIKPEFNTDDATAPIRIGYGTGIISKTLFYLLEDDIKEKIRNIMKAHDNNEHIPSSRKIICIDDTPTYLMGWCELKLERVSN